MNNPFACLTNEEFDELNQFLLYDVADEGMTIDTMDGFLHAIAVGPTDLQPLHWSPKIWGTEEMMPPMESIDQLNHVLGLVMRHFNSIIARLESDPREIDPRWTIFNYQGNEYDDAEGWASGFVQGMRLSWNDWQPMLQTSEGQAWFRPIGLLGEDDFGPDQDAISSSPAQRAEHALQIPEAVLAIHRYLLPMRLARYEREVAKAWQPKVGRNDPCPCGKGVKFRKCCGSAINLH
jgi:uncharacterized protein